MPVHGLMYPVPQSYPVITPRLEIRSIHSQNGLDDGTSANVWVPAGTGSVNAAALLTILASCPRVTSRSGLKHGTPTPAQFTLSEYPDMYPRLVRRMIHR